MVKKVGACKFLKLKYQWSAILTLVLSVFLIVFETSVVEFFDKLTHHYVVSTTVD